MEQKKNDLKNLERKPAENQKTFRAWALAWELGYSIAIPIVLLALGGRLLDKRLDTSPLFILIGILLSIVISSWLVYKKTKPFL